MTRAVLKAGQAPAGSRGMCGLDLRDIAQRAAAMLAEARSETERISHVARERLRIERDDVLREARRLGREEGAAQGREEARAQALAEARERLAVDQAERLSAMTAALRQVNERREHMYVAARRDVVILAIAIASRMCVRLGQIEEAAADMAAGAVGEALELVGEAHEVLVRLHPADASAVEELLQDMAATARGLRHVRLVADESIGRGGALVSKTDGEINATLSARLERIADELVENWRDRMKVLAPPSGPSAASPGATSKEEDDVVG